MANFPTPSEIQAQYFQILKSIKPSLNVNDPNSDFVLRGNAVCGLFSGAYGDQESVDNDTFISTMSTSALLLKGQDFGIPPQPATAAECPQVQVPAVTGTIINPGDLTFQYGPTGVLYTNSTGGTAASGILVVEVVCEVAGQIGNIESPDTLQIVSPPTGVGQTATLLVDMADGADPEDLDTSYRARLLTREQNPPAGGNSIDYPNFAFAASPAVRSATIYRFILGLGTVGIYITTGTTDIDTAVTQGQSIVRIPSSLVLDTVQAYYNTHAPLPSCNFVYPPTEADFNATVNVDLAPGLTMSTIPSDPVNNPLGLTVQQLIQREVGRAMYKTPIGGRKVTGTSQGYLVAADIEHGLDEWLSAVVDIETGLPVGKMQILINRQCQQLNSPTSYDTPMTQNQLAAPGTITVVQGGI